MNKLTKDFLLRRADEIAQLASEMKWSLNGPDTTIDRFSSTTEEVRDVLEQICKRIRRKEMNDNKVNIDFNSDEFKEMQMKRIEEIAENGLRDFIIKMQDEMRERIRKEVENG